MVGITSLLAVATSPAATETAIKGYLSPILTIFATVATLLCTVFLSVGGYWYMTAAGDVDKLTQAKKIIRNALIGLLLVLGATLATAILSNAYAGGHATPAQTVPSFKPGVPIPDDLSIGGLILKGIVAFLKSVLQSAVDPIMNGLSAFLQSTPLMAQNATVFSLWVVVLAIANVLFIAVVALLGFHIMSANVFGYEELSIRHLLPRIGLIFVLMNSSIFAIDVIIGLANAIVNAFRAGIPTTDLWKTLSTLTDALSGNQGIITLLLMVVMAIFGVILYVYYITRLLVLYLGAVLAPLMVLLCLLPAFRDFAISMIKTYIATIFVILVHVVILTLAASLLVDIAVDPVHGTNGVTVILIGIAAMMLLLKTQTAMSQAGYATAGLRTARKMGATVAKNSYTLGKIAGMAAYVQGAKKLDDETNKARAKMVVMSGGASPQNQGKGVALRDHQPKTSTTGAPAAAAAGRQASSKRQAPAKPAPDTSIVNAKSQADKPTSKRSKK